MDNIPLEVFAEIMKVVQMPLTKFSRVCVDKVFFNGKSYPCYVLQTENIVDEKGLIWPRYYVLFFDSETIYRLVYAQGREELPDLACGFLKDKNAKYYALKAHGILVHSSVQSSH